MIIKKIPAQPSKGRGAPDLARHARQLIDYMRLPEKENPYREQLIAYMVSEKMPHAETERLVHIGALNFVSETIEGRRAEMMATAQAAVRSSNPIDHWLLSWGQGEFPSNDQVDEVAAMLLDELGLKGRQCVYALHGDTHNRHLHLAINRYDPVSRRTLEINGGFNHEAGHAAVAVIVERFGWKPVENPRYVVEDGRAVLSARAKKRFEEGERSILAKPAAYEWRTGYKSAQRIAQEEALPILRSAASWSELHARLAEQGMRYEAIGTNGAVVIVGDEAVKASYVHRQATITALSKRLGAFTSREPDVPVATRAREGDILPGAFRADEYRKACDAWAAHQTAQRERAAGRKRSAASPVNELRELLKATRPAPVRGMVRPPKDLESFYYERQEIWFANRRRKRQKTAIPHALQGETLEGFVQPDEIDGYCAYACREGTRYARDGEGTAFIDTGTRIEVVPGSDEALLAALKLAVTKFDRIMVKGDQAFKSRLLDVALEHGLADHLANPEFATMRALRERKVGRAEAKASTPALTARRAESDRTRDVRDAKETIQPERRSVDRDEPTTSVTPVTHAGDAPAGESRLSALARQARALTKPAGGSARSLGKGPVGPEGPAAPKTREQGR